MELFLTILTLIYKPLVKFCNTFLLDCLVIAFLDCLPSVSSSKNIPFLPFSSPFFSTMIIVRLVLLLIEGGEG